MTSSKSSGSIPISSSSSKPFVTLFLVLVLVPSLVSKKNCPTRWDSLFLVMYHMLEVKKHSTTVLEELEWEKLRINGRINLP